MNFFEFLSFLLNFCSLFFALFAVLVKKGDFFVHVVYLTLKKQGLKKNFLEGWYTYKTKIICYNILSRAEDLVSAECEQQRNG